jgi:hypothetical protein
MQSYDSQWFPVVVAQSTWILLAKPNGPQSVHQLELCLPGIRALREMSRSSEYLLQTLGKDDPAGGFD